MKKYIYILLLSIPYYGLVQAQTLNDYVNYGIEHNLALKQNMLTLEQAEYGLRIAKGMFLPAAGLQTRYSLAQGGRIIDLPLGDLMNPVYSTLNQMLEQQGQPGTFPMLENQQINFLRNQEYDASISVVQPIYSRALSINKRIAEEQLKMSQEGLSQFKRELTFYIKEAYYNYLQSVQMVKLINRTKDLVQENHRITQKLHENNMVANDAVLRAKSDVSQVLYTETNILKSQEIAKSYFNFLLNRQLTDTIYISVYKASDTPENESDITENALKKREELRLIESQMNIAEHLADLNSTNNIPQVALALNAGLQGEGFESLDNSEYAVGSIVLNWTLFQGKTNKYKREQALLEKMKYEYKEEEMRKRIELEVKSDFLSVNEQMQNLELAQNRQIEAAEVYRIVSKRYKQGEASLIEILDARNNMVEAEAGKINTEYNLLISIAKLEKSSSSTTIY